MAAVLKLQQAALVALLLVSVASDPTSSSSPDVLQAADYAIGAHNAISTYPYAFKVLSVQPSTIQLYPPARVLYVMTVQAGETVCTNEPNVDLANCKLRSPAKRMTCEFEVLAVPFSHVPSRLLRDECNMKA